MARFIDSQKTIWKFYYSLQVVDLFVNKRSNHDKYPLLQFNLLIGSEVRSFGVSVVTPFSMLTIGVVL